MSEGMSGPGALQQTRRKREKGSAMEPEFAALFEFPNRRMRRESQRKMPGHEASLRRMLRDFEEVGKGDSEEARNIRRWLGIRDDPRDVA